MGIFFESNGSERSRFPGHLARSDCPPESSQLFYVGLKMRTSATAFPNDWIVDQKLGETLRRTVSKRRLGRFWLNYPLSLFSTSHGGSEGRVDPPLLRHLFRYRVGGFRRELPNERP